MKEEETEFEHVIVENRSELSSIRSLRVIRDDENEANKMLSLGWILLFVGVGTMDVHAPSVPIFILGKKEEEKEK